MHASIIPTIRKANKRIIAMRIILLILIVLNLTLIWSNSSKVSKESDKTSKSIAETVAKKVVKDYESLPESVQKSHVKKLNTKIRSMAHFAEFIPLGLFLFLMSVVLFEEKRKRYGMILFSLAFSLTFSLISATGDEIHQIFVKGRSFELKDILTDVLGSFCGALAGALLVQWTALISQKKTKETNTNDKKAI